MSDRERMETTLADLTESIQRTRRKLDQIDAAMALRHAAERSSATVILNPLDDLLAELQLLASSVIVGEIKDQAVRGALLRFARRFEELDKALSGGLPLPAEWSKRRKR